MKLNDRQIKLINYPSKGRDTYSDGNSLYLRVTSKHKIWSYQYRYGSRVLRYTIGRYPQVSLKEARKVSFELKQKIYKNINPQIEKLQKRRALLRDFNYYLDLYIENYVKVNLKSYKSLRNTLNYYLLPKLGKVSLELAYAITVHKSQGSEYEAVIIQCSNAHSYMLKRNLIYTALTRGKKKVIMVGQKKAFLNGLQILVKRNTNFVF